MLMESVALMPENNVTSFAWSHLRRFRHVPYVVDRLIARHKPDSKQLSNIKKQAQQIRLCLQQAEEYFEASNAVSLVTRPTLFYYSVMCLALAEVLFKQGGDSSLDKARSEHRHHGLIAKIGNVRRDLRDAQAILASMRALPLINEGKRTGTFELWHRSARTYPVGGVFERGHLKSFATLFSGDEDRMEEIPAQGISLLDCYKCIPGLWLTIKLQDIIGDTVRARVTGVRHQDIVTLKIDFHPGPPACWQGCAEQFRISPKDHEAITIIEYENHATIQIRQAEGDVLNFRLPSATMLGIDDVRFLSRPATLNEFGYIYVAMFVLGSFARYYPDLWIKDVEGFTSLAHLAEQLLAHAAERVPVLLLSELSGELLVPGTLS